MAVPATARGLTPRRAATRRGQAGQGRVPGTGPCPGPAAARRASGHEDSYTAAVIRPVGPPDLRFLRDMLRHAYFWRMGRELEDPVFRYVRNWGRRGDFGLVAFDESLNRVGASWYRLFRANAPGFGFVDETTPELTLAVVPARRGEGFGHELLDGLLARASGEGYPAVSLSAPKGATALYEGYGFRPVRDEDDTVTMVSSLGSGHSDEGDDDGM